MDKSIVDVSPIAFPFMNVGCTLVGAEYEKLMPSVKSLNRRGCTDNQYIGSVLTHPDENTYIVSRAYIDHKENDRINEDYFVYRVSLLSIQKYYGRSIESDFPQYRRTHKDGDKSYFRTSFENGN